MVLLPSSRRQATVPRTVAFDFRVSQQCKKQERHKASPAFWSKWRDSNSRHPAPKAGALPTALHLDSHYSVSQSRRASCCGTRHLRRRRSAILSCRPLPLAWLPYSATGGGRLAPQLRYTWIELYSMPFATISQGENCRRGRDNVKEIEKVSQYLTNGPCVLIIFSVLCGKLQIYILSEVTYARNSFVDYGYS